MISRNSCIFVWFVFFVVMLLCVTTNNGRADSCSGINVGVYKEKLLSVQSEYAQESARIGSDNLKSNELLVGREIDSLIQDVDCIGRLSKIIQKYCEIKDGGRIEIWRELVVFTNKSLDIFHGNIGSCHKLLRRSLGASNRFDMIVKKTINIIDGLRSCVPRELL